MKKIGGFIKNLFFGKKYHIVRYIAGYVLLWVILCLFITNKCGQNVYDEWMEYRNYEVLKRYEEELSTFRETAKTHDMTDSSQKVFLEYQLQRLTALATVLTDDDVRTCASYYNGGTNPQTYGDLNAYLVIFGDNGKRHSSITEWENSSFVYYGADREDEIKENTDTILRCKKELIRNVWDETLGVKMSRDTAWMRTDYRTGWTFEVLDGYLAKNEFQPGKVRAIYYENGRAVEEKVISCTYYLDGRTYEYVENMPQNRLYFPEDTENWKAESRDDLMSMMQPISGRVGAWYPVFYTSRYARKDYEVPISFRLLLVQNSFIIGDHFVDKPFSFFPGDVAVAYSEIFTDVNGNETQMALHAYVTGMIADRKEEVFSRLRIYYIALALLIALIAFIRYRKLYSLRAKNQFHKSLIDSMAHDLKTPLMIMQGFGENLAENVHTEKREYYAAQIQENVARLNTLIDKNLELARHDGEELRNIGFYGMKLVENTEKRLGELLEQKKLTIKRVGDTMMHGDPDLMQTVVDNLIGNAIKYAPEGDTITVVGNETSFSFINHASLMYGKNVKHLLEPLEMGEESRTSGSGSGLGLSIANAIVREHGYRLKLSYDRKRHEFMCTIYLMRWR